MGGSSSATCSPPPPLPGSWMTPALPHAQSDPNGESTAPPHGQAARPSEEVRGRPPRGRHPITLASSRPKPRASEDELVGDPPIPDVPPLGAYGYVKKAAALVNAAAGRLDSKLADAIVVAADEVIAGQL